MKDSTLSAGRGTSPISVNRATALSSKETPPAVNLVIGAAFDAGALPPELRNAPRWTAWRRLWDAKWQKPACHWSESDCRYITGYKYSRDASTLETLAETIRRIDEAFDRDELGVSFVTGGDWVALDFDNVSPDALPPLLADHLAKGRGYWCRTTSGYGVRVIGKADPAFHGMSKRMPDAVAAAILQTEGACIEFKANGGTATTTTHEPLCMAPNGLDISELWGALVAHLPQEKPAAIAYTYTHTASCADFADLDAERAAIVVERCRKSVLLRDLAKQGQNGSKTMMSALRYIQGRWGLRGAEGEAIAREYNARCEPPFSEAEFTRAWNRVLTKSINDTPKSLHDALSRLSARSVAISRPEKTAGQKEARAPRERVPVSVDGNNDADIRARIVEIVGSDPSGIPVIFERLDDPSPRAVHVAIKETDHGNRYPVIVPAGNAHVREAVTRCISFTQRTQHGVREVSAKDRHLEMVREIPQGLPKLRRVLHGPSYDAATDTILNTEGYDRQTGCLLAQSVRLSVPDRVTHADAQAAAQELLHAFRYIQFKEDETGADVYRARFLTELMTVLLRSNFTSTPAFMHVANVAGGAKSYLARASSLICHGRDLEMRAFPSGRDADTELQKQLVTIAANGAPIACYDNLERGTEVASKSLELLTTSGAITSRAMGESRDIGGQYRFTLILTGNQIRPRIDFRQRVLEVHLAGAPDGRKRPLSAFGDQGDLVAFLRQKETRRRLLSALITIARGYQQAGRPHQDGEAMGSLSDWLHQCVDPIRWALGVDPLRGQAREWRENDSESQVLDALMDAIRSHAIGRNGAAFTTAELFKAADPGSDLREAMESIAHHCGLKSFDQRSFGKHVLAAYREWPVEIDGVRYRIESAGLSRAKTAMFRVAAEGQARRAKKEAPETALRGLRDQAGSFGSQPERDVAADSGCKLTPPNPADPAPQSLSDSHTVTQPPQTAQLDGFSSGLPDGSPVEASESASVTPQAAPQVAVAPPAVCMPAAVTQTETAPTLADHIKRRAAERLNTRRHADGDGSNA